MNELIIGLLGGFILSFYLWWILNHRLVPSIEFSEELSRRPISYSERAFGYQFAFKNTGKRSVINIRLRARFKIKDITKKGGSLINYFDIALTNNEVFELKPGAMLRYSLLSHKSEKLSTSLIDERIVKKYNSGEILLDDVFDIYPNATCFIQIIGSDIYTSATKVFQSNFYSAKDIRNGKFIGKELSIVSL